MHLIVLFLVLTNVGGVRAGGPLESLAWLEGHWETEAFGGVGEEFWLPASGDAMHGVFRLMVDGQLNFSEFIQLTAEDGQVMMRFKHFQPDYSTWEKGEELMELVATKITSDHVVFEGSDQNSSSRIVYMLVGEELHVHVNGVDEKLRFYRK
jgi:hypothetical protein